MLHFLRPWSLTSGNRINFYLIAHYFPEHDERLKKRKSVVFNVFIFSIQPISAWKMTTKLCDNPISPRTLFAESGYLYHKTVKHFWKCWEISEIHNSLISTLPGKSGKRSNIFETKDGGYRPWCRRIRIPLEIVYNLLPSARFVVSEVF